MNKKIFFTAFFCIFVAILIFFGCKDNELKRIQKEGVIKIGTTGDYIPMSYYNKKLKRYEGFDIAVAEDLAEYIGVKPEYIQTSWPALTKDIKEGKFDIALGGITITKKRKEDALMSKGYLINGKSILCRREDIKKYKSLKDVDIPNVKVMENPGGLNEKFARENLKNAQIIIHDINYEIPELIASKKADVMITEIMEAKYYAEKNKKLALPLGDKTLTKGEIGIMLPKKNKKLLHEVNQFLKKEEETGRIKEFEKTYVKGQF